ncbi:MAG: ABC transporter permease subunit [Verrucomicrobiota bacterium]|nr:ABC transporter permease subunit [Verrucomicrobiota bacterium]
MRAIYAITGLTIRSSLRSHIFQLLLVLLGIAIFILPLTLSGDGTAMGQVQIMLKYSLGIVSALLAVSSLWLGSAVFAQEIESYSLHMIFVKPVPRWKVWFAKWLGIFLLQAVLLGIAGLTIYFFIQMRVETGKFSSHELSRLRGEVLVGRRLFHPDRPDFKGMALDKYRNYVQIGLIKEATNSTDAYGQIIKEIKAKSTEVRMRKTKKWTFRNISLEKKDANIYLRFRMYLGKISSKDQRFTQGIWSVKDPETNVFIPLPRRALSGHFHELTLSQKVINSDGTVTISYENMDPRGSSVIFQISDGPFLMVRETGFQGNFVRLILLLLMQLAFFSVLGCAAGATLSLPVAIYFSASYLAIGLILETGMSMPFLDESGQLTNAGLMDYISYYVSIISSKIIISPSEFVVVTQLAKGHLVEFSQILRAFFLIIVLRGLPIASIGAWIFTKREMGKVIRK